MFQICRMPTILPLVSMCRPVRNLQKQKMVHILISPYTTIFLVYVFIRVCYTNRYRFQPIPIDEVSVTLVGRDSEQLRYTTSATQLSVGRTSMKLFCPVRSKKLCDISLIFRHHRLAHISWTAAKSRCPACYCSGRIARALETIP